MCGNHNGPGFPLIAMARHLQPTNSAQFKNVWELFVSATAEIYSACTKEVHSLDPSHSKDYNKFDSEARSSQYFSGLKCSVHVSQYHSTSEQVHGRHATDVGTYNTHIVVDVYAAQKLGVKFVYNTASHCIMVLGTCPKRQFSWLLICRRICFIKGRLLAARMRFIM